MTGGISHILCGVDGSAPACMAAERSAELALALGAALTYIAVAREGRLAPEIDAYQRAEGIGFGPVPILEEAAELCLTAALTAASTLGYKGAWRIVRTGKVSPTLIAVASEIGADTIMIGRKRHSGIRRAMFGSVAQEIADQSSLTMISVCC